MNCVPFLIVAAVFLGSIAQTAHGDEAAQWSARIDERLAKRQQATNVRPAPVLDDAAFLRRVSLDLLGRIPTVAETRTFLADSDADKRRRLVREQLAAPISARHWATVWRRQWIPEADAPQFQFLADDADEWLAAKLHAQTPHDRIVAELLTGVESDPAFTAGRSGVRAFLVAGEDKPENLAAHATRAFLGVNLDCAQCHDHPFARWTRDQFWETAAFFAYPTLDGEAPRGFLAKIPETDRVVEAKFLTPPEPAWPESLQRDSGRRLWADWVVSPRNPFFARHAVNTIWAQLFGHGLVEPLDDLSSSTPESDQELLRELAEIFIRSGFDSKLLIEAIVMTDAYRRARNGAVTEPAGGVVDPFLFAQAEVRALTGEQTYDSLRTAAGLPVLRDDLARREVSADRREFGRQFLTDHPVTAERSILQALQLMNGKAIVEAADFRQGPVIVAAAEGPFALTPERIDVLFLATVNRKPTAAERNAALAHFSATADVHRAAADLFWALVNTAEFNTNH